MRILITGSCGVTSRAVARSLRMSKRLGDLYLVGTDICDNPYGIFEGLLDRTYRAPRVNDPGYHPWMTQLCAAERVDAAIVIPELEVLYWSAVGFPVATVLPPAKFCQVAVSKRRLYESLAGTGLVPEFRIMTRDELTGATRAHLPDLPCWLRDFSEGGSSGKGSLLARSLDEVRAWVVLNPGIDQFMLSQFLPGRNYACHLMYDHGTLVKIASYERLEYFMARTAVSGVTGNISKGRLVNDPRLVEVSQAAVTKLATDTGETMHGLVAVDLREAADDRPMVTEINLRHVAATSAFAAAEFNLSEAQLMLALGRRNELGPLEATYPEHNMILRDIDGAPIWIADYRELAVGESADRRPGAQSTM